jgi:hypothetical protein
MQKIFLLVCAFFAVPQMALNQSWNATVTTSITNKMSAVSVFSNRMGVHVVKVGGSDDSYQVKYSRLNSSGTSTASYSFDTGGKYPVITGDNSLLYVCYQNGATIKVWKSTDAGSNWSHDGNIDITMSSSNCNGIDAAKDWRGLHVVYAVQVGSYYETYYNRYIGTGWTDFKNVTDFTSSEVGGLPTIALSSNKVHVSYNTGVNPPDINQGNAKTRDYNFQTLTWEDPQLVLGYPSGQSMVERIYSDNSYVHLFYYKFISGMGSYSATIYHTKRVIDGTTWSTPEIIQTSADVDTKIGVCSTADGKLHVTYPGFGLKYRNYDGTTWNTETLIGTNSGANINAAAICSVSNDLFVVHSAYLQSAYSFNYRQYDAVPTTPANLSISGSSQLQVNWNYNPEPDIQQYEVWRKFGHGPFGRYVDEDWTLKTTTASNSWTDPDFRLNGANDKTVTYKLLAKDVQNNSSVFCNPVSTAAEQIFWKSHGNTATTIPAVPTENGLYQNYPNPFNPTTQINYGLKENGAVKLIVYDMLGREISVLVNEYQSKGNHSAVWNAANLSTGTYVYRISVKDENAALVFSEIRRMLVLK